MKNGLRPAENVQAPKKQRKTKPCNVQGLLFLFEDRKRKDYDGGGSDGSDNNSGDIEIDS